MAEIEMRENLLKELIPQVEEAQFINNKLEINLSNMKKEKDRIIRELIAKKQMKEIYDEKSRQNFLQNLFKIFVKSACFL